MTKLELYPSIEEFEERCRQKGLNETDIKEKVQAYGNMIQGIIDGEKYQSDNIMV